ncbi:MAG: hypothetical protein Q9M31_02485 [Mariprofundus sp.]|nr:hypothetical protein [Mariprofundus sp.]
MLDSTKIFSSEAVSFVLNGYDFNRYFTVQDSDSNMLNSQLGLTEGGMGKIELSCRAFDLCELMEDTVGIFSTYVNQKGLELLCLLHQETPTKLYGDADCIQDIIVSLLTKILKVSHDREVVIMLHGQSDDDHKLTLHFEIDDVRGDLGQKCKIYDRFNPFEEETSALPQYSTHALSSCTELIKLMGGDFSLESHPGKGTTVKFDLQVQNQSSELASVSRFHSTLRYGEFMVIQTFDQHVKEGILHQI